MFVEDLSADQPDSNISPVYLCEKKTARVSLFKKSDISAQKSEAYR